MTPDLFATARRATAEEKLERLAWRIREAVDDAVEARRREAEVLATACGLASGEDRGRGEGGENGT
jgi:hypothetical protein